MDRREVVEGEIQDTGLSGGLRSCSLYLRSTGKLQVEGVCGIVTHFAGRRVNSVLLNYSLLEKA